MRLAALLPLLRMRYKLMWAQVRLRSGKKALFMTGYFLALLIVLILVTAGAGSGFAGIRTGRAELIARVVLGAGFVGVLLMSVLLGFGVNKSYSSAVLKRYPITSLERLAARQFIGVLDPTWLFAAALYLGVAVGFSAFGATVIWLAVPAALLLTISNYLLARLFLDIIDRLIAARSGSVFLIAMVWCLVLGGPALARNPAMRAHMMTVLQFTPPFFAAAVMAGRSALLQLPQLLGWCLTLAGSLYYLEGVPLPSRTIAGAEASFGSLYDQIAGCFPGVWAPLVGKTLRYYLRCPKVRYTLVISLPLLAVMVVVRSHDKAVDPQWTFVSALFASSILGVLVTSRIDVNVFGYEGSGFRRFLISPVSPVMVLRSVSLASMIIGAAFIPFGLLAWTIFSPYPNDWRMPIMLASSAFAGLFIFRGLAVWTSILFPKRASYSQSVGNQLSLGGNVVMLGATAIGIMVPTMFRQQAISGILLNHWWAGLLLVPIAAGFFFLSLDYCAGLLGSQRERLLSVMEGKT